MSERNTSLPDKILASLTAGVAYLSLVGFSSEKTPEATTSTTQQLDVYLKTINRTLYTYPEGVGKYKDIVWCFGYDTANKQSGYAWSKNCNDDGLYDAVDFWTDNSGQLMQNRDPQVPPSEGVFPSPTEINIVTNPRVINEIREVSRAIVSETLGYTGSVHTS